MRRKYFKGYIKNIGFDMEIGTVLKDNPPIIADFYKEGSEMVSTQLIAFGDREGIYDLFKSVIFFNAHKHLEATKFKVEVEKEAILSFYIIKRLYFELE